MEFLSARRARVALLAGTLAVVGGAAGFASPAAALICEDSPFEGYPPTCYDPPPDPGPRDNPPGGGGGGVPVKYVALGDSYSSGTGAFASGQTYTDRTCRRSKSSYPVRLAVYFKVERFHNRTCHGARASDIADQAQVIKTSTRVVTVTGGGNDLVASVNGSSERFGFSGVLKQCVDPRVGCARIELATDVVSAVVSVLYREIRRKVMLPEAKVFVLGYPRFVDPAGCGLFSITRVDAVEAGQINEAVRAFDKIVKDQAEKAGFTYVNALNAFVDDSGAPHYACSAVPWVHGVVPPPVSNPFDFYPVEESFHPMPVGHAALLRTLLPVVQAAGY
jgi:lysophospholipase L1-like esterase